MEKVALYFEQQNLAKKGRGTKTIKVSNTRYEDDGLTYDYEITCVLKSYNQTTTIITEGIRHMSVSKEYVEQLMNEIP